MGLAFRVATPGTNLLWLLIAVLLSTTGQFAPAATNDLSSALQKGLFEEEANRNLDAAIASYQSLVGAFDKDRKIAATAVFRLGEVYRKQGRTNEAAAQYERIVREFADQDTLVTLSRQNLTGLGAASSTSAGDVAQTSSQSRVAELQAALARKQALLTKLKALSFEELERVLPTTVSDSSLIELLQQESMAEQKMVMLKKQFAESHPTVVQTAELLKRIQEQVKVRSTGILEALEIEVSVTKATLEAVSKRSGVTLEQAPTAAVTDSEEQEIRRIQAMIRNSPDLINAPGSDGATPLHGAANQAQLTVARFLLDNGANPNARNKHRDTPLILAAGQGHKTMVEFLLSRGAEVNAQQTADGTTALGQAAFLGFKAVVETLVANKADIELRNNNGETPLHLAASKGHSELVEYLLSKSAAVNTVNGFGNTPLILASAEGHSLTVKALLSAKAEPNTQSKEGRTALSFAAEKAHADVVKVLLEGKADPNAGTINTPLASAAYRKHLEIAELLLQSGADPNLATNFAGRIQPPNTGPSPSSRPQGSYGPFSPLQIAVSTGNAPMIRLLLKYKADPNTKELSWITPPNPLIFYTVGDAEMLKAFLDGGADPDAMDRHGKTPLIVAAAGQGAEITKVVLEHGAKVNVRSESGQTPLHFAAERGDKTTVELLLAAKADVNARSDFGITPLHSAVWAGHLETTKVLLANGADPNIRNNGGGTPLDYVKPGPQRSSNLSQAAASELAALLRQHGALDDLPDFNSINVSRTASGYRSRVFWRSTNDWSEYSLTDLLMTEWKLVSTATSNNWPTTRTNRVAKWGENPLRFPDLAHITIHRPAKDGKSRKAIPVNLVASLIEQTNAPVDFPLQFGDIVEVPEADHPVSESWGGPDGRELDSMINAVTRKVTIKVSGKPEILNLSPSLTIVGFGEGGRAVYAMTPASFMLRSVLDQSKLVRSSSDLFRVKVTRKNSSDGKSRGWVVDCSTKPFPDLWLQDGDVIEVPEK